MDWKINHIPDQSGRVVLVTGANSGLGFETAKALLCKGATVIMGCRSMDKGLYARKTLLQITSKGNIDLLELDLADLIEVNRAANQLISKYDRLDLLINNAGLMAPPRTLSNQGLEIQFAVNHLAHMALTLILMPLLSKTSGSRVVTVTSGAQYMGEISWDDLQGEKLYDRWAFYSQSKLANVMFALELENRLRNAKHNVSSMLAHPGLARTNLQLTSISANNSWQESLAYKFMGPFFQSAEMGVLPQLFAATDPKAQGGEQYGPRFNISGYPKLCRNAPLALRKEERERLWKVSETLIANQIELSESF